MIPNVLSYTHKGFLICSYTDRFGPAWLFDSGRLTPRPRERRRLLREVSFSRLALNVFDLLGEAKVLALHPLFP
jgi:hypothetical protein